MKYILRWREWGQAVAISLLCGCAGNGAGLDQSGRPVTGGGGTNGPLTADYASIQSHVFTPICTACHAGGGAPQGLRLDATNAYASLVGVPSNEVPGVLRVKPGNPGNSYIIQKIEGHAAVGARMPFGGPYLDQATIDTIRQWITDGAQRGAGAAAAPLAVTSISPMSEDFLPDGRARLIAGFSEELDQTRLDSGSVRLERLDPGTGLPVDPVAVEIAVPAGNPRALMVITAKALGDGRYRLVVPAAPETGLSGVSGRRLEGAGPEPTPVLLDEFDLVVQK